MSNFNGYGVVQGPEVNIRMKVDIYTEGENEGMTFDQVVHTGPPDDFDHEAWLKGLPKASINALPKPQAPQMIEYPDQEGSERQENSSDRERRHRSSKSRRHRDRNGHLRPGTSQSSISTKTPREFVDPESGGESERQHRSHRHHREQRGDRQHRSKRKEKSSRMGSDVTSQPLSSSTDYQNTSRELDDYPPPPPPPPLNYAELQRPHSLPLHQEQPSTCPLDVPGAPEIPESYSRQETPAGYLVETPGQTDAEVDPGIVINTFEEPAFTPAELSALLRGRPQSAALDEMNASIGKLVRVLDERMTTTTVKEPIILQQPIQETQRPQLSPALSTGSRKFGGPQLRVSFNENDAKVAAQRPRINPRSRETLIDDPGMDNNSPSVSGRQPTDLPLPPWPFVPSRLGRPPSRPTTPEPMLNRSKSPEYSEIAAQPVRPRSATPERSQRYQPREQREFGGAPQPYANPPRPPVPAPRRGSMSGSTSSLTEIQHESQAEKAAKLGWSNPVSVNIAPFSKRPTEILDIPPQISPPRQFAVGTRLPTPTYLGPTPTMRESLPPKPNSPVSPVAQTPPVRESSSPASTPSALGPKPRRVNPNSYETVIDDVPEPAPIPLPSVTPQPYRSPTGPSPAPPSHNGDPKSPASVRVEFNAAYASSQHDESFTSSGSQRSAQYRPPLGDWMLPVDNEDERRSRSTTASTAPGIPLVLEHRVELVAGPGIVLNRSGDSDLTPTYAIPPPPRETRNGAVSPSPRVVLDLSQESDHSTRQNVPSSKIFEMYTKGRGGSGTSESASTPSPLPPQPAAQVISSRSDLPPPPPPPVVVTAPMAELDESLDDGTLSKAGAHRHSIYTISEADTLEEEEARSSRFGGEVISEEMKRSTSRQMKVVVSGGWTGTARSRSSIDSERSSVSGAVRAGGSYNLREGGSLLGDGDNLSDYLQGGRLTPLGKEWDGNSTLRSTDSVISEASNRADASNPIYGTPGEEARPKPGSVQEKSFAQLMKGTPVVSNMSLAEADSLRWKKFLGECEILDEMGAELQEQMRREFFGTGGSQTSVSSFGAVEQDAVRHAPVVKRKPMETGGGMYGEAVIGMASVGREEDEGRQLPMTDRLIHHPKAPSRPTAL